MLLRPFLSVSVLLLILLPAFSATCYRQESYCSQYAEFEYNCRNEGYSYSCQKYGPYQSFVSKTCYENVCETKSSCEWKTREVCDTRTLYNTCQGNCLGLRYKNCLYFDSIIPYVHYGRHSSCGTESYVYSCNYPCNPYTEKYNCRNEPYQDCTDYQDCKDVPYDCSTYETVTGWYSGTCYGSRTVCDKATDYDNCVAWSDKEVAYECSLMKLNSYSLSSNSGRLNNELQAAFFLSDCEGAVDYELFARNVHLTGRGVCGSNLVDFMPASTGTQTILLKIKDSYTSITKSFGSVLITDERGEYETFNPFNPLGEEFANQAEAGFFDEKILEGINQGLSNENILKNLMLSFGAIGLALTTTQAGRIKSYIESLRSAKSAQSQKMQIISELEQYEMDYYYKKYLYDSWQNEINKQLNSKSTYYEVPAPITLSELNEAKKIYEDYLNSLMNNNSIQDMGRKERENADLMQEYSLGAQNTFVDNLGNTATGALLSGGIAYTIGALGVCATPIGAPVCAAGAILGIAATISNIYTKDKYSNLMAYLYGVNSDEYAQARTGQITFYMQTGVNVGAGMIGGYYGHKTFISNKIANAYNVDGVLIDENGNVIGHNHESALYDSAAKIFPQEAYIFNNGKLYLNGKEVPPETVFDTFYDAENNRYLEIQLGTSENKNGLMHMFKDHNFNQDLGYDSPTEIISDIKLSMKNYVSIKDMGDSWRYCGDIITTPNGNQIRFEIAWSKINNNLQTGWLKP